MFGILKVSIAESYKPSDFDLPDNCLKDEFIAAITQELINNPLYVSLSSLIQDYDIIIQEED